MRARLALLGVCAALIAPGGPALAASAQPCVMLVFNPDNSVVLNGSPTDLPGLATKLAQVTRRSPVPRICMVAGPQSNPDEVQAALDVIRKTGLVVNMTNVQTQN